MNQKTRITDLADKLGISTASVSRALNDKPGVSAKVRQRVLATANELEYSANPVARNLAGASTGTIGFILRNPKFSLASDPFYFLIMQGAERELDRAGYHLILSTIENKNDGRPGSLRMVREGRVDAVIVAGPDVDPALVFSLSRSNLPVVLVDNAIEHTPFNIVLCDDYEGAHLAVDHLISHGHQAIAYVGGPTSWLSTRERQKGYEASMREAGLKLNILHEDATSFEAGQLAGKQLLSGVERPTAIFAINDATAMGIIRAARDLGLKVPGDLAIIGFDDVGIASTFDPPLTTVRVDKEAMGTLAARRVLDLIKKPQQPYCRIIAGVSLVTRQSCGCPAKREEVS